MVGALGARNSRSALRKHAAGSCWMSSIGRDQPSARGKAVFVAATKEHTGKTSVSMSLLAGLIQRLGRENVAYMKPVGQKHVLVQDKDSGEEMKVDKDVRVARVHFGLQAPYRSMSPLVLGKGYTKAFLDGKVHVAGQRQALERAFQDLINTHKVVVVEGTGHTGVGSIVGWNNAEVAKLLGVDVMLVANGGLGSTFDQLSLNRNLCLANGVNVKGILLNKAMPSKVDMVGSYIGKAIAANKWETPILGVIPDLQTLDKPSVQDLEQALGAVVLAGRDKRLHRFDRYELVTTSLRRFMEKLHDPDIDHSNTCFVTHASRNDIILGLLSHANDTAKMSESAASGSGQEEGDGDNTASIETGSAPRPWEAGLMLTGRPPGNTPHQFVCDYVSRSSMPVLSVPASTSQAMRSIEGFTAKMTADDRDRTQEVVDHYSPHIQWDKLMHTFGVQSG